MNKDLEAIVGISLIALLFLSIIVWYVIQH
jgi:hypothetical protein